ncbi:hypothetical protein ABT025_13985 [Streptomyces sp. NPDC002809]|uniref:hypothetical protein n=1 Tax=Streptomyces sp. NPDC002809 TaxID=3154433 RepID=UPI0033178F1E
MSGLDVDTQGLGKSGQVVEKVADRLVLVRDDYLDKVTSYHGCWGDGAFGDLFASMYVQGVEFARAGITELSAALSGSATSLTDTASSFRSQQGDVLDALQSNSTKQH